MRRPRSEGADNILGPKEIQGSSNDESRDNLPARSSFFIYIYIY